MQGASTLASIENLAMTGLLKDTWNKFNDDNCARTAASLAYSAAFSMAPILVIVISLGQIFVDPQKIRGAVQDALQSTIGEAGVEQLQLMADATSHKDQEKSVFASTIGVIVMLVGATGFFAELQAAMNEVWNVKPDPAKSGVKYFLSKRLLSLGMVLSLGLLALVSIVASAVLTKLGNAIGSWMPERIEIAVLSSFNSIMKFLLLTTLFAAMFRVLPDAQVKWKDVVVGALMTATLFVLGEFAITLYLEHQNIMTLYGAAGSLIVLLSWVYYSTLILLFGAELTYAWASRSGKITPPIPGAISSPSH